MFGVSLPEVIGGQRINAVMVQCQAIESYLGLMAAKQNGVLYDGPSLNLSDPTPLVQFGLWILETDFEGTAVKWGVKSDASGAQNMSDIVCVDILYGADTGWNAPPVLAVARRRGVRVSP